MAADGESRLRFSPTIELGHLLQVIALLGAVGGWGLVGYYRGPADDDFDPALDRAVRLLQRDWGLPETGVVERATWAALAAAEARLAR
jgi:murein L,D-transpeptidase YcbB/YkuD